MLMYVYIRIFIHIHHDHSFGWGLVGARRARSSAQDDSTRVIYYMIYIHIYIYIYGYSNLYHSIWLLVYVDTSLNTLCCVVLVTACEAVRAGPPDLRGDAEGDRSPALVVLFVV